MGKAPAFQMYAADFLTDVSEWSIEEVGIYIRLLCYEWVNGTLPNDPKRLARCAHCSIQEFNEAWDIVQKKFKLKNDRLYNTKLEKTREQQLKYREAMSDAGKRGAESRWHSKANGKANGKAHNQNMALQSSTSTSTSSSISLKDLNAGGV